MFSLMLPTMYSAANPFWHTSPNAPQQFVIGPDILDSRLARLHDKRNALERLRCIFPEAITVEAGPSGSWGPTEGELALSSPEASEHRRQ